MDSVKITLEIVDGIEEVFDLGYTRLYVNVDDLENGNGFLRVLAMYVDFCIPGSKIACYIEPYGCLY